MQSPPRRSRLFRPTPQRPRMRRRTTPPIPPVIRVRTPQRWHRWRRPALSRGSKHPALGYRALLDSQPDPAPLPDSTRSSSERHCGIFQRPPRSRRGPAAARVRLAPSPRGTSPPRARVFPQTLGPPPPAPPPIVASPPPLSRWTCSPSRSHRLSDDRRRRSRFRAARSRVAPPRAVPREPPASTPTTHPANANARPATRRATRATRASSSSSPLSPRRTSRMASISSSARALRFEHELRARGGRQLGKLGGVVSRSIELGGVDGPRGRHIGLASRGRQGQGRRDRRPHRVVSPRAVRLEATRQSGPRDTYPA